MSSAERQGSIFPDHPMTKLAVMGSTNILALTRVIRKVAPNL